MFELDVGAGCLIISLNWTTEFTGFLLGFSLDFHFIAIDGFVAKGAWNEIVFFCLFFLLDVEPRVLSFSLGVISTSGQLSLPGFFTGFFFRFSFHSDWWLRSQRRMKRNRFLLFFFLLGVEPRVLSFSLGVDISRHAWGGSNIAFLYRWKSRETLAIFADRVSLFYRTTPAASLTEFYRVFFVFFFFLSLIFETLIEWLHDASLAHFQPSFT